MRLFLASLVLAGAAVAQTPQHRLFEQPNLPHSSLAYFEAFRGAEAACTCTPVTGAKGEALTFSRASTQTCTKTVGVEPQAIANGDLVSCASGQPAVMPGADGTGVAGLLVEGAGTNEALRSEEFNNAAWVAGGTAPTVTADFGSVSPFAAPVYSYADRVQFSACPAGAQSILAYTTALATGPAVSSVYARGTSGAASFSVCDYAGSNGECSVCSVTANEWTRCYKSRATASTHSIVLGCNDNASYTGHSNTGAADVLLLGAQVETGTVPTSYIPTGASTASRVAVVSTGPATLAGNVISIGETWLLPSTITASASAFTVAKDASNYVVGYASGGAFVCDFVIGGVTSSVTGPALTAGTSTRVACTYDAAGRSACVNGACTTTAGVLTLFSGASSFYFGTRTATGNEARNVVKRACLDQVSASRCVL